MARIRKAGRLWREDALATAAGVMVGCEGPVFSLEPNALFSRNAPLELEIGAGRGEFIIERAAALPDCNFLAVELSAKIAQLLAMRAARSGVTNLRVVRMDARTLVHMMLPDHSLAACHIYFPDPWPKMKHSKHRLFSDGIHLGPRPEARAGCSAIYRDRCKGLRRENLRYGRRSRYATFGHPGPRSRRHRICRKFLAAGVAIYSRAYSADALAEH